MHDYYLILGIIPGASFDTIKQAYRDQLKRFHPDLNQNSPQADRRTQLIIEAYNVLIDPAKRSRYDTALLAERTRNHVQTQPVVPVRTAAERIEKPAVRTSPRIGILWTSMLLIAGMLSVLANSPAAGIVLSAADRMVNADYPESWHHLFSAANHGRLDQAGIDRSVGRCREACARIALYVKSRIPALGVVQTDSTAHAAAELDRTKLDERIIHPLSEEILLEMLALSTVRSEGDREAARGAMNAEEEEKARVSLAVSHDAVIAMYYNAALLEQSIGVVQGLAAGEGVANAHLAGLRELGSQPDVARWLERTDRSGEFESLMFLLSRYASAYAQLEQLRNARGLLAARILSEDSIITAWKKQGKRSRTSEQTRRIAEYQTLAKTYLREYQELEQQCNVLVQTHDPRTLTRAFDECINLDVLLAFSAVAVYGETGKRDTSVP